MTAGTSKFKVGGAFWSRIASRQKIASIAPAAHSKRPTAEFDEELVKLEVNSTNYLSTAASSITSAIVDVPWEFM